MHDRRVASCKQLRWLKALRSLLLPMAEHSTAQAMAGDVDTRAPRSKVMLAHCAELSQSVHPRHAGAAMNDKIMKR